MSRTSHNHGVPSPINHGRPLLCLSGSAKRLYLLMTPVGSTESSGILSLRLAINLPRISCGNTPPGSSPSSTYGLSSGPCVINASSSSPIISSHLSSAFASRSALIIASAVPFGSGMFIFLKTTSLVLQSL